MELELPNLGLRVKACGLFLSSGKGSHPDRVLNDFELIVVRRGKLSIWENDTLFDVPAGHALILYPGRRHRGATPFGRDLSFYWIHWVVEGNGMAAESVLRIPQLFQVCRPEYVAELFHRYLDDRETNRLDPYVAAMLLLQILLEVRRDAASAVPLRGAALVGRAEAYIIRHMADRLSAARIARALRVNPDYLTRVFREVHGMTLTEYLNRRKLQDAAKLLRESSDPIAEIAVTCGYSSVAHFRRLFQRYNGVSPREYRRLNARAFVNAR